MRNRWMYYATGLPGWMRFGYSPGWVDRSPTGLGPCASYMMTGQWPIPSAYAPWGTGPMPGFRPPVYQSVDEVSMLRNQAQALRSQLESISKRLEELEKES